MKNYTSDIAQFTSEQRAKLIELMQAWQDQGSPPEFIEEGVRPIAHTQLNQVFLINNDEEMLLLCGDSLEMFYPFDTNKLEGNFNDLVQEFTPSA